MKYTIAFFLAAVSGFLWLSVPTLAQSPIAAREELNEGIKAFKQAHFEDAITHFKLALESDPHLLNAHLYLATAYSELYIPGNDSVDNMRIANQAIEQYKVVIESKDPVPSIGQQANSIKGVASLNSQMKKFDEARQYYKEAIKLDPADPENYYVIGVIDWTESYRPRMEIRVKLDLKPTQSLIHKPECWQLKSQNGAVVKDGIEQLTEAIRLRPDYDDAIAYLNLMFRERADIQCGDDKAYNADTKAADRAVDLTLETKKVKSLKENHPTTEEPQRK